MVEHGHRGGRWRAADTSGSFTTRIRADNILALIDEDGTLLARCDEVDPREVPMNVSLAQLATVRPSSPGSDGRRSPKRDTGVSPAEAVAVAPASAGIRAAWPIFVLCLGGFLTLTWSMTLAGLVWLAVQRILF